MLGIKFGFGFELVFEFLFKLVFNLKESEKRSHGEAEVGSENRCSEAYRREREKEKGGRLLLFLLVERHARRKFAI